ncbi:HET-domain-containing protein [Apiospora kogelbergensis]|uniref:HET-domain-containing protein n=1 Tax=Apiospora kogelbergensis TaxID=1337665 RepID=A0AAW0R9P4_9PEZI
MGLPSLKSSKKPVGLCKRCDEINFDSSTDTSVAIISLFDIIKTRQKAVKKNQDDGCKLCSLLFDVISIHDPFQHSAIKDHMPKDLQGKSFKTWAEGLKWTDKITNRDSPFGKSNDIVQFEAKEVDQNGMPVAIGREDLEAVQNAVAIGGAIAGGAAASQIPDGDRNAPWSDLGSASQIVVSTMAALKKNNLPVVVTIKINKNTQKTGGLLNVAVVGYGNAVRAPLSVLSSFNLRVASDYHQDGLSLSYGRIITDRVNVEADCRKWMDHCRENHQHLCAKPDWSTKLPPPSGKDFRLIEINETYDKFKVSRVGKASPDSSMQEDALEYAALSYVWGKARNRTLQLRTQNIEDLRQWTSSDRLDNTVKDAVEVTRRLGLRYLWVDSLCVIQDEARGETASDTQQSQIDQMASIYGCALVTIVATAGEDASAGLAGISSSREARQMARDVKDNFNVLLPIDYDTSYGKWDTRGWTLQEKLLSRRMLVFGENHASFHCRHGVLREDMPAVHAGNGPTQMPYLSMPSCDDGQTKKNWEGGPVLLRSPFFDEYAKLLEQYTSRNMTRSTDILNGVSGLLKALENMRSLVPNSSRDDTHTLYGLPEDYLDLALLWQPPADSKTQLVRRMQSVYPSWSWAGWEVNKGHSEGNAYQAQPGVRMEDTFRVSGNDDCSLRKFLATGNDAEERVKPLVMWYRWKGVESLKPPQRRPPPPPSSGSKTGPIRPPPVPSKPSTLKRSEPAGQLVPVNGHGLGIAFDDRDLEAQLEFLRQARRWRDTRTNPDTDLGPPQVPSNAPLKHRHLVCETQAASFRLRAKEPREEHLWKQGEDGTAVVAKTLHIREAEILDDADNVVGYIIPTDKGKDIATPAYDFVLLSESQYWGNETRIDVVGFPLYNVMAVEWDEYRVFAERVGVGKISKVAWDAGNPTKQCVVLR